MTQFPEPPVVAPLQDEVPGMGLRLLARVLDWLLIGAGVVLVLAVGVAVVGERALLVLLALLLFVSLAYEVVMIALWGATLGKRMVRLKVVQEDTRALPGWRSSFVRWLVPALGVLACGIGEYVVYLSPYLDHSGRERGWHDKAAHTVVVRT